MKNIIFKDQSGTELTSHVNQGEKAVICIEQNYDFLVYIFDDADEIEEFIKHLNSVKKDLIDCNNG